MTELAGLTDQEEMIGSMTTGWTQLVLATP